MSPNLYDLLDVDPGASTEEIREAWRHAIEDLGPTDRRFRAYTDAAGVLLDPERRAAYDAELAADEADEAGRESAGGAEESAQEETGAASDGEFEEASHEVTAPTGHSRGGPGADSGSARPSPAATSAFASRPSRRLVAGVTALALVIAAATTWVLTWPGTFGTSPEERAEMQGRVAQSIDAAERIAPQVLSYDYRTMGEERIAELGELMTPTYAEEWARVQEALRDQATKQEAVVTAAVRGSAMAEISDDGDQAEVLVFVDQLVQKGGETVTELTMWATLRLIHDDATWRLEKICTTDPDCA